METVKVQIYNGNAPKNWFLRWFTNWLNRKIGVAEISQEKYEQYFYASVSAYADEILNREQITELGLCDEDLIWIERI